MGHAGRGCGGWAVRRGASSCRNWTGGREIAARGATMTRGEYAYFQTLLKERSGLNLGEDNRSLLDARLRPLLKEFRLTSLSELAAASIRPEAEYLRSRIAQAVTVQESYFSRSSSPHGAQRDKSESGAQLPRRARSHIRLPC